MVLADGEHNGFAKLATDGVTQAVGQQGFAKQAIGGFGEKLFLETALLEALLAGLFASRGFVDDDSGITQVGQQLGGDIGTCVHHQRVDQKAVFHTVQQ